MRGYDNLRHGSLLRLPYVPVFYPDELEYSVVCRYHRHTGGFSYSETAWDLFGRDFVKASLSLPGGQDALAATLAPDGGLTGEDLVRRLTLHDYYAAFVPPDRAAAALACQRSGSIGAGIVFGVSAFYIPEPKALKFCCECLVDMEAVRGEMWWRRAHQLPGMLVCPEHGSLLRESSVHFGRNGLNSLWGACRHHCPDDAPMTIGRQEPKVMAFLLDVARRSAALLESGRHEMSYQERRDDYKHRLLATGLMRSTKTLNVPAFVATARDFLAPIGALLSDRLTTDIGIESWAYDLLRRSERNSHPLLHILMEKLLDGLGATDPFGKGPWFCRNPVLDHEGIPTITTVDRRRTRDFLTGVYECACGHSYVRRVLKDGSLGEPRYRSFGASLDIALTRMVADGLSQRKISKALHLHPAAVSAAAHRLGLGVSWVRSRRTDGVGSSNAKVRGVRRSRARVVEPQPRRHPGPRRDWTAEDANMLVRVEAAGVVVAAKIPFQRVCCSSIEKQLGIANWINARRGKLPRTSARIAEITETQKAFQERRIWNAIETLKATGRPVLPYMVLRKAAVRAVWLPSIRIWIAPPA